MDEWWRSAVIYQVYPRSFADADGDGEGDLAGVTSRLDHLATLGIDAVWLNPFYTSPQADGGYDVADYRDVDPRFGTLADFDDLVAAAHRRDVRVIVDLVPNHSSDRHPWFQEALASEPGSAARRRYVFREGRGSAGDEPPNNWRSVFGGSAWTRTTMSDGRAGEWYLHLFDTSQPDLNWTNDEVRAEFESILRFWLDRGVDGFRIDVAHGLAKDPGLADLTGPYLRPDGVRLGHPHWDREEVHDVYRSWRRIVDGYRSGAILVGEVSLHELDRIARYLRPDELQTAFNFEFLLAPFDAPAMRAVIDASIAAFGAVGAPATWVLGNHDKPRPVTRYGGGELGLRRARAAALLMLALPGGAYVYQGEELGLPEVLDLPDAVRQDPAFWRTGGEDGRRDGCRVPIPWSGDEPSYGFGPGAASWLPQPPEWASMTVEREAVDPDSTLSLYRSALRIRRERGDLGDGALAWLDAPATCLVFRRSEHFVCAVNLGDSDVELPPALASMRTVLASIPGSDGSILPAASARWLVTDDD